MARIRLEDVAKIAGVSMKTVSNVVHDYPHVSPGMRERVQRVIDELGYRPNALGRRLATGKTGLLALAFADVSIPYFSELARVVSAAARSRGYRLLLEQTDGTLDGERAVLSESEAGLVDGVLFQPSVMSSTEIAKHRSDVPLVLLGEASAPLSVDHVMIDNIAAASEATQHLAALGRSRIGFVGHEEPRQSETSRQRLIGYQEGLEKAGLRLDMSLLLPSYAVSAEAAAQAVGAALERGLRFDALVCRDDLAAIGTLRALKERGFDVPRDVAVTGWDNISLTSYTYPSLTTIAADTAGLAEKALDMLSERIAGFEGLGRHTIVDYRLIPRESAPAAT
ncbi:LacI family DNA-binding transcriptional regulator [Microbacterium sp. STN6]|uniref:LacI family DNA-binding transcriptional regulator n=1 Tax=Microbacterium sp. STN6 TaxID=2995588 RepID=UPI002260DE4E|nr:LacI family DNA-binding transcriptional regulator [Microbacterium sp. STN6]MCX7521141.1 LacI family DNA-binding transcriptional regulator [Microbacterium sp. STN6]